MSRDGRDGYLCRFSRLCPLCAQETLFWCRKHRFPRAKVAQRLCGSDARLCLRTPMLHFEPHCLIRSVCSAPNVTEASSPHFYPYMLYIHIAHARTHILHTYIFILHSIAEERGCDYLSAAALKPSYSCIYNHLSMKHFLRDRKVLKWGLWVKLFWLNAQVDDGKHTTGAPTVTADECALHCRPPRHQTAAISARR